jgi:biopolymer transport protein ExbB/TolQ
MKGFSVIEMWESMSIIVKCITTFMLLLSVWTMFAMIERFVVFRRASVQNYMYVLALRDHLAKRKTDEALKAARIHHSSPVAKVVESGLVAYKQGREALETEGPEDVGEFDLVDSVNRSLERVKERETANLRRRLGGLATVASIAPFVGLLGTVFGIISAFHLLSEGGGIAVVGPGIAEALVSTAVGLFVAIPSAMAFNYYTGRVENFVVDMNDVSSEFVDFVLKEGRA